MTLKQGSISCITPPHTENPPYFGRFAFYGQFTTPTPKVRQGSPEMGCRASPPKWCVVRLLIKKEGHHNLSAELYYCRGIDSYYNQDLERQIVLSFRHLSMGVRHIQLKGCNCIL